MWFAVRSVGFLLCSKFKAFFSERFCWKFEKNFKQIKHGTICASLQQQRKENTVFLYL